MNNLIFRNSKKAKIDYFDANLLNRKMVVSKMLTKSGLLTILRLTKSGFHCSINVVSPFGLAYRCIICIVSILRSYSTGTIFLGVNWSDGVTFFVGGRGGARNLKRALAE